MRTLHQPALLGQTLNRLGNWYVNIEDSAQALRHHREALDIFEELNDRHGLVQTLDLLGLAHFVSGDLIEGSACYQRAIDLFRALDDRVGLSSALALLPRPRSISLRRIEKEKHGGLTERERQVAGFIAQGKSNREIAAALFVGERTIETHVSNILSKLGFDARTQIAAWAAGRGLIQNEG